jgi:hypothetical protein
MESHRKAVRFFSKSGRSTEDADLADLTCGHGGVLGIGAGGVDGGVWGGVVWGDETVLEHPGLDFFTADVGQHGAVDFDTGRQRLTAFLFHFPTESGVFDDVLLLVRKAVLTEDGADALAPPAEGFEVGRDLWGFSRGAHGVGITSGGYWW